MHVFFLIDYHVVCFNDILFIYYDWKFNFIILRNIQGVFMKFIDCYALKLQYSSVLLLDDNCKLCW